MSSRAESRRRVVVIGEDEDSARGWIFCALTDRAMRIRVATTASRGPQAVLLLSILPINRSRLSVSGQTDHHRSPASYRDFLRKHIASYHAPAIATLFETRRSFGIGHKIVQGKCFHLPNQNGKVGRGFQINYSGQ